MASARFEIYETSIVGDQWRWKYVSANGVVLARGDSFFTDPELCRKAVYRFCHLLGVSSPSRIIREPD